jgi:serine/threonine-protein kinase RsbW
MSESALTIPADTEQVRLVRLVACAAARRTGMSEEAVDEVRLAVGEAVGRAVVRHQRTGTPDPVTVRMIDADAGFAVEVRDAADGMEDDDFGLAMAVITGLVPDTEVRTTVDGGQILRMSWGRQAGPDL